MIELLTVEHLSALAVLAALEIVLGIDNIIFLAILVDRLPESARKRARFIGLSLALVFRVLLLMSITWIMGLAEPFMTIAGYGISGKGLILIGGGLFLIWKATFEIHHSLEVPTPEAQKKPAKAAPSFAGLMLQLVAIDLVFSLDSVITAVGMASDIRIMVTAVVIAILVMMIFAGAISEFILKNPTLKMLALSFLLLVGILLITDGFGKHVDRGYLYFAMAFSTLVEMLNMRIRKRALVKLNNELD